MEEYDDVRPLDKLLVALKEHDWECIVNDVRDSLIVIDTNGDFHECWDGGSPDHVNVVVAMTIDDAITFFSNPLQIADAERMFKANVDKNNDILDLHSKNTKLWKLVLDMMQFFEDGDWCDKCNHAHECDSQEQYEDDCLMRFEFRDRMRELE